MTEIRMTKQVQVTGSRMMQEIGLIATQVKCLVQQMKKEVPKMKVAIREMIGPKMLMESGLTQKQGKYLMEAKAMIKKMAKMMKRVTVTKMDISKKVTGIKMIKENGLMRALEKDLMV